VKGERREVRGEKMKDDSYHTKLKTEIKKCAGKSPVSKPVVGANLEHEGGRVQHKNECDSHRGPQHRTKGATVGGDSTVLYTTARSVLLHYLREGIIVGGLECKLYDDINCWQ
jgi:hypothetical protein